jgi:ribosome-binding factor A
VNQRIARVQSLAREVMGDLVANLKDPRIGFATVTAVRVSADLRHARVFVSVMGTPEEQAATMAGLASARSRLRSEMGRQMRLRYSPELVFELDTNPAVAERLESLFKELHARDLGDGAPR